MNRYLVATLLAGMTTAASPPTFAGACDNNRTVCTDSVSALWTRSFSLQAGVRYRFWTSDLAARARGLADTAILVMTGDLATAGPRTVIAKDDDGYTRTPDPNDSYLSFVAPFSGDYTFVVMARDGALSGTATINIWRDRAMLFQGTDQVFGNDVNYAEFRAQDRFFVGKGPGEPGNEMVESGYHDTLLLVLDDDVFDCNSNCGRAWLDDDSLEGLSKVDITHDSNGSGTIVVGTKSPDRFMQHRTVHTRRHVQAGGAWNLIGALDLDGDGLTAQAEWALGTCDHELQNVGGMMFSEVVTSCAQTKAILQADLTCPGDETCWSPRDTDNDGLTDLEEVYGARRCYVKAPTAPYFDPGPCVDTSPADGVCDHDCTGAYVAEVAISAVDMPEPLGFDGPDPQVYDVLVETRYWKSYVGSTPIGFGRTTKTNAAHRDQIRYTYAEEGLECANCAPTGDFCKGGLCCDDPATDCPNDQRYQIKVHVIEEEEFVPSIDGVATIGANFAGGVLARKMTPARRFTNTFRFGLLAGGGGQAGGYNVKHFVSNNSSNSHFQRYTYAHELGHALGLYHGGSDADNYESNYLSLMNYAYSAPPLKERGWNPTAAIPCTSNSQCSHPQPICRTDSSANGYCMPACGVDDLWGQTKWPQRFSRGRITTELVETDGIDQYWHPQDWLLYYSCRTRSTAADRFFTPSGGIRGGCFSPEFCGLDLDQSGSWNTPGPPVDLDLGGTVDGRVQDDENDWLYMMARGRRGLRPSQHHWYQLYHGSMNAPDVFRTASGTCNSSCANWATPWNMLPWQPDMDIMGGLTFEAIPPHTSNKGPKREGMRFHGAGTSDHLVLGQSDEFESLGSTIQGRTPLGYAIHMWINAEPIVGSWQVLGLLHHDSLDLYLLRMPNGDAKLVGFAQTGGQQLNMVSDTFTFQPHQWRKIYVEADRAKGEFRLGIDDQDPDGNGWVSVVWVGKETSYAPQDFPIGDIVLGRVFDTDDYTFDGMMDEVAIFSKGDGSLWDPPGL